MQVEELRTPGLTDRPVVIGGGPGERRVVADCSEEAEAMGVCPGMPLREALSLCPDAALIPPGGGYERVWEEILFALGAFTLRVEAEAPGLAYLDMTKVLDVNGDEKGAALAMSRKVRESSRMRMTVGVGNSRFIARQAASRAFDALVIPPGAEREFLSLLPVGALPLSEGDREHLRLLGLYTIKDVGRLSRKALVSQFGREGAALFDMVHGADEKSPIPRRHPSLCVESEVVCDVPLDTAGGLRALMEELAPGLADELGRMRMACRKMEVALSLGNGDTVKKALVMKRPTAEAGEMAARLLGLLEGLTLASPVVSVKVSIPCPAQAACGEQEGLFTRKSLFLERLDGIRAYFEARYGHTPLVRAKEQDRYARLPERRFSFVDV
jgi:nucleotidyltransferase/DNA polymerase involved in DNA repair